MSSVVIAGNTSGSVTLSAPDVAGTTTLTLPSTSGNVLTSASSLTASQLPAGSVLQVLQTVKTDTFSTTSGTLTDVTGLSITITPSSASNKILIMTTVWASASNFLAHIALVRNSTEIAKADAASNRPLSFLNYSDDFTVQNSHGKIQYLTGQYLDSPSTTSAVTYKIQAARRYDNELSPTTYINRSVPDRDTTTYDNRKISTITVMEIKG